MGGKNRLKIRATQLVVESKSNLLSLTVVRSNQLKMANSPIVKGVAVVIVAIIIALACEWMNSRNSRSLFISTVELTFWIFLQYSFDCESSFEYWLQARPQWIHCDYLHQW